MLASVTGQNILIALTIGWAHVLTGVWHHSTPHPSLLWKLWHQKPNVAWHHTYFVQRKEMEKCRSSLFAAYGPNTPNMSYSRMVHTFNRDICFLVEFKWTVTRFSVNSEFIFSRVRLRQVIDDDAAVFLTHIRLQQWDSSFKRRLNLIAGGVTVENHVPGSISTCPCSRFTFKPDDTPDCDTIRNSEVAWYHNTESDLRWYLFFK